MRHRAVALALTSLLLVAGADGDVIKVMISGGFTQPYLEAIPEFQHDSRIRIETAFGASMGGAPDSIPARLQRGEPVDVVIMASTALEELIANVYGTHADRAIGL
jgi:molybdate transport system substrate-binding protein